MSARQDYTAEVWDEHDVARALADPSLLEGIAGLDGAVARRSPEAWMEAFGRIKVKDRSKGEDGLQWLHECKLGWLQKRLCEIVSWCLANKKPIRLLVYKKRQTGASTASVGLMHWFCNSFNMDALIVGGAHKQVANLWEIFKCYNKWDACEWGHDRRVLATGATFGNGSRVVQESMEGKEPGRSGTWTFLLCTEVARWAEEGVKNAGDVLTGISNGVPRVPLSCVIWETTVRGGSGAFYDKWKGAVEFEDFKDGIEGNGFIRVFEPWYLGFDSAMPVSDRERNDILSGRGAVDAEEQAIEHELLHEYKLSPEQIKFWRWALEDCQGDPDQRDRDFPTTPEHGFRASVPGRFNMKALKFMRVEASRCEQKELKWIQLVQPDPRSKRFERVVVDKREATFMLFEDPQENQRYLLTIDPMQGMEDSEREGRDKRDTHGVTVLRLGHFDGANRMWRPDKVAACTLPKTRWPVKELGHQIIRLAQFYGNCLVVPEANFDSGLIRDLREAGLEVYEREKPPTDKDAGQKTGKYGFLTRGLDGEGSRRAILENLADAIRFWNKEGRGVDCSAVHIVDELQHFIIKDGKEQALSGKFDDHVMALAMALALKSGATRYVVRHWEAPLPGDVALMERQRKAASGNGKTHRK